MTLRQLLKYTVRWTLIFTCIFHKVSEAQTTGLTTTPSTQTTGVTTNSSTTFLTTSSLTTTTQNTQTSGMTTNVSTPILTISGPETVLPSISNSGTNDTIIVSWNHPLGKVEEYVVVLNSSSSSDTSSTLYSNITSHEFQHLIAGKKYTAIVISKSGNFSEASQPVTTATYPNPPGKITIKETTTNSISIEWTPALWMNDSDGFNYTVSINDLNGTRPDDTKALSQNLTDLISGTPHVICVRTTGPLGLQSEPVCSENVTTKPHPIRNLAAETLNTTSIKLKWDKPSEYKKTYIYQIQTSGCASQNYSTTHEEITITNLTAGTNCLFNVYVQTSDDVKGEKKSIFKYTRPETVLPSISNNGTNDTIIVSWNHPLGKVENYVVVLNNGSNTSPTLYSNITSHEFQHLIAGKKYTAIVISKSGNFSEASQPVTTATYPNPPGKITIKETTTNSISIEWAPALWMDASDGFDYTVSIRNSSETNDYNTKALSQNLTDLISGTPHVICVRTTGPLSLQSGPVCKNVTSKPEKVTSLEADKTGKTYIRWKWETPLEYKDGYRYEVSLSDKPDKIINVSVAYHNFTHLTPGVCYHISVTTFTSDGTKGSPVKHSNCTDTSPVVFKCVGPNHNPVLNLTWENPEGENIGFKITVRSNSAEIYHRNESTFNGTYVHTTSHLAYSTEYTVTIYTVGYGKWGVTNSTCTTGITAPPVVSGEDKIAVVVLSHNKIKLILDRSFLNSTNGPIKAYGVLVSKSDSRKFKPEDLQNSYSDWEKKQDLHYLSVLNTTGLKRSASHTVDQIQIILGDDSRSGVYRNGPLYPTTTYRFAIVTFTELVMTTVFVDTERSIFSISENPNWSEGLPQNPFVIILAVAVTCGVLLLCLCIAIAVFIILKRRDSGSPASNIPLSAIRAKTSVPVRIEEFNAYYKRQSANSKCGFAEEYEDLKPVGTAQSTTTASALENKSKNRYSNVLPYEPSRVKLSILNSQFDDYINANYVPGANSRKEFIACQGPLPATVNDFWRMIWEKNIRTIVMLTRCNEQGRVKCEQYWPPESKHYNNIIVTTTSEIALDDWTLRDFDIKNVKTAETRSVRQFHYTAWPDHGVPQTTELLINFRHLVREHMDQYSLHSPTVVHCSAGVGRTGTFIAIDRIIFQIERESMVDVYGIVYDMRMHRPLMVQTEDQYVYLNQCALDIIRSRMGTNVDLIYQNTEAINIYENVMPNKR